MALLSAGGVVAPMFNEAEWEVIKSLSPAEIEQDSTNKYVHNQDAAILGKSIFFDERFSSNKKVSCATCHKPELYFTDGKQTAIGTGEMNRNTPTVLNAAHQRWFFWDGRADTLWGQPIQTMEHPDEMNLPREQIISIIADDNALSTQWEKAFGKIDASEVDENASKVAKSIAAYITKLDSSKAPFDAFVAGDHEAITDSAKQGLKFFINDGGCLRCHFGPWFSDGAFHSVGIGPLDGGPLRDSGRAGAIEQLQTAQFSASSEHSDDTKSMRAIISKHIAKRREDWGSFRTPSLRNVAETPPYMHAGQLTTLADVIEHYSTLDNFVSADHHRETILEPLKMNKEQKKNLIDFLHTLTAPLPDATLLE